jgi:hypothetical protein
MKTQTLFTALAIAQARMSAIPAAPARFIPGPADDTTLLNALRNSATHRDQIIQRRIGMIAEAADTMQRDTVCAGGAARPRCFGRLQSSGRPFFHPQSSVLRYTFRPSAITTSMNTRIGHRLGQRSTNELPFSMSPRTSARKWVSGNALPITCAQ